MKTFVVLSCYTAWGMFFSFLAGIVVTALVAIIVRLREKSLMKSASDLKKMSHFIQRYYWLMKKGKITEAQKKALKKTISIFANRIMESESSVVELTLATFTKDVFKDLASKIRLIYNDYNSQFVRVSVIDKTGHLEDNHHLYKEDFISQEDALKKIESAFEEIGLK